jgi:hypothetical protein
MIDFMPTADYNLVARTDVNLIFAGLRGDHSTA